MNAIFVLNYLLKCFIHYLLKKKKDAYHLAFSSLVRPHSFRLSENHSSDYLISLKYYKKALTIALQNENDTIINDNDNGIAIYESTTSLFELSKIYIEKILNKDIKLHISKDALFFKGNFIEKILIVFFTTILLITIFPVTLLKKNKGIYALILLEYTEMVCLLIHLKKNTIREIYYFDILEKDANFIALVLQKNAVKVYKIPSESPLDSYKDLITDVLCLTSAYQQDEIEVLRSKYQYFINEILIWPPYFVCSSNKTLYFKQDFDINNKNTIGFISSGTWRRKERKDFYTGDGYYESEEELIVFLKEFLNTYPGYKLFIYPHPCERTSPEVFERAKKYYSSVFTNAVISFPEMHEVSRELFPKANITISVYSNASFERLYCGFKSLFAPIHINYFPINKQSTINNITIKSKEELFDKLLKNANISTDEFFNINSLNNYKGSQL